MGCGASRPADAAERAQPRSTTSTMSSQTTTHDDVAIVAAHPPQNIPTFLGYIDHARLTLPPPSVASRNSAEALRAAGPSLLFTCALPSTTKAMLNRKRSHDFLDSRHHTSAGPLERRTTVDARSSAAEARMLRDFRNTSEELSRRGRTRGDSTPASGMGSITGWQLLAQQVFADMELDNPDGDSSSSESMDSHASDCINALPLSPFNRTFGYAAPTPAIVPALPTPRDTASFAASYELIEVLGQGAFGRAMKARRLADGRMCCIKVLRSLSPKDRSQAVKEANLLASLHHPNIVQYCDAFIGPDEELHLVMEFCGEGDLAQHLHRRQGLLLEEDDIMRMFVQISLGLHHVHKQGIMCVCVCGGADCVVAMDV